MAFTVQLGSSAVPLAAGASSRRPPALQQLCSKSGKAPPARHSVVMRSTGWSDPKATGAEKAMFGENFGARDPFAAEIASNFGDKVLGNYDTDHIIKVPTSFQEHFGLTARQCEQPSHLVPLEEKEVNLLKQQVPGWKVIHNQAGRQVMRQEWRALSLEAAQHLQASVSQVATSLGHPLQALTVSGDLVVAELTTPSLSALSINDFVLAARINELDLKPLLPAPRKRFWA